MRERVRAKLRQAAARMRPRWLRDDPTSEAFFEQAYRGKEDPWEFASSEYELRRYGAIVEALRGRRYRDGVEPGCSIGVLTCQLAKLCGEVYAADISGTAAEAARRRCAGLGNVRVFHAPVQELAVPEGYDLLVFSEIGYYFREAELAALMGRLLQPMARGGTLLASHWLGKSPDHVLRGDAVHEILGRAVGLKLEHEVRYAEFRLDRWVKD